jgi:hypothetical protein
MKSLPRKASWFLSGLLFLTVVLAGLKLVVAQPKSETSKSPLDSSEATFESLGAGHFVNMNNVTYTTDDGQLFDIHFACSGQRGEDPLRLMNPTDIKNARSYFDDENRYGKHFVKVNKHRINVRNIAYIVSTENSVVLYFNARVSDDFVKLTLVGADADVFRK